MGQRLYAFVARRKSIPNPTSRSSQRQYKQRTLSLPRIVTMQRPLRCFLLSRRTPRPLTGTLALAVGSPGGRLLGPRDGSQWTGLSQALYTVCLRPRADPRTDPSAAAVAFGPHTHTPFLGTTFITSALSDLLVPPGSYFLSVSNRIPLDVSDRTHILFTIYLGACMLYLRFMLQSNTCGVWWVSRLNSSKLEKVIPNVVK